MLKRKKLSAILGTAGALVLLFGGLSVSVVSAQEITPQAEDAPAGGICGHGRGLFGFGPGGQRTMFDTAAEALGLTPEELFSELHAGKTLEEVAEDRGVEVEELQEALKAIRDEAVQDEIAQAVAGGEITQDEADWRLEGLERGYMSGRGFGHGFERGMRRGPGPSGPGEMAPQSEQSDTSAPALPSSSSL
jgi:hypothetical protein